MKFEVCKEELKSFGEIAKGTLFRYDNDIYLKTQVVYEDDTTSSKTFNALKLGSANFVWFGDDRFVVIVSQRIIISN